MRLRALQHTHLVAAVGFLAAVLVLAVQLISPSQVMVSLGESGAETVSVGEYFTYREVAVIAGAAFVCGVSGTYLVLHDQRHIVTSADRSSAQTHPSSREMPTDGGATPAAQSTASPAGTSGQVEKWEANLERLADNQETVYELLIEGEGKLPQRKIVERTDLSKATVSRTLDTLEHRGLVERKRSGMGNTIHLQ
ncbi:helix-turn-helix transcriptional regulator [Haloarcula onubensis]|uniref:helix-turn-helix transcriptional regulator n=1 Tax=Haloarcula onubensis TaxID=2950539 RepID=UPI003AACD39A